MLTTEQLDTRQVSEKTIRYALLRDGQTWVICLIPASGDLLLQINSIPWDNYAVVLGAFTGSFIAVLGFGLIGSTIARWVAGKTQRVARIGFVLGALACVVLHAIGEYRMSHVQAGQIQSSPQ
jgi:hypothetical protein